MIYIDCLPTKVFLIRRGIKLNRLGDGCPWCYRDQENAMHLFFFCNYIAKVKWRPFEGFSDFFTFCKNVSYTGVITSLWMISVFVACWSVWIARNELTRALMWFRSVYEEWKVDERIWWVCPYKSWCNIKNSGLRGKFWCSLYYGGIKFNVCGVIVEDEAGCGGVLINSDGVARALFSGPISAKVSIEVEGRAVSIALDFFLEMGWKGKCSLVIEVGSIEVINWLEVDSRLSLIGFVSFLIADKNENKMAVALAGAGLKRQGMFKSWW
ncbi:hypothetical protein ES288_A12G060100v1 [Gossypium darwinii]|uniref:Reverse transcriptase zinc-binding domain-containing protein n=1 Tax=Gossypium darwinii TaxID=34276 RepID=A0A5D2E7E0_GOSDA|nr:hypothetical protein ES288_A12G060100v1 [Gossypium darwinii]